MRGRSKADRAPTALVLGPKVREVCAGAFAAVFNIHEDHSQALRFQKLSSPDWPIFSQVYLRTQFGFGFCHPPPSFIEIRLAYDIVNGTHNDLTYVYIAKRSPQ